MSNNEDVAEETIDQVQDEELGLLQETSAPRKNHPPLLQRLNERPPEQLHCLGTSCGHTTRVFRSRCTSSPPPSSLPMTPCVISISRGNNMADHHLITVLLPSLAKLVTTKQLGDGGYKRTAQCSVRQQLDQPGVLCQPVVTIGQSRLS